MALFPYGSPSCRCCHSAFSGRNLGCEALFLSLSTSVHQIISNLKEPQRHCAKTHLPWFPASHFSRNYVDSSSNYVRASNSPKQSQPKNWLQRWVYHPNPLHQLCCQRRQALGRFDWNLEGIHRIARLFPVSNHFQVWICSRLRLHMSNRIYLVLTQNCSFLGGTYLVYTFYAVLSCLVFFNVFQIPCFHIRPRFCSLSFQSNRMICLNLEL